MVPIKEIPYKHISVYLEGYVNDETVGTSANHSRQVMPQAVTPLPDQDEVETPENTEMGVQLALKLLGHRPHFCCVSSLIYSTCGAEQFTIHGRSRRSSCVGTAK